MYNLKPATDIDTSYLQGLLPQRTQKGLFYQDTSCRSNLQNFSLSSENRRILSKTDHFSFDFLPLKDFSFTLDLQKQLFSWVKTLGWDFPVSSIKTVFTNHIFNYLYVWKQDNLPVAYSICYFSPRISHIAYVFYDPQYARSNLPIRLTLQAIIDSHHRHLDYCYLGRFSFYKRNFPGFESFQNGQWSALK